MAVRIGLRALALLVLSLAIGTALAQTTPRETRVSRLIVKFRDTGPKAALALSNRIAQVATDTGVRMSHRRSMALGAHVLDLEHPLSTTEAAALVARLARHADIEFVQADQRRHAHFLPNDTYVNTQTYLQNSAGGISAIAAWDTTTGSPNTIVAIVDSGYRPHADLAGRILPGYDFISDAKAANDGDGRDPDASDPGDWISAADAADPFFKDVGCDTEEPSSWHGTAIAGVVAANANNGQWLAGIDWAAKILPVRVLGKCGGDDADILDGVAWAAGLPVPGVPANPHPAQVVNLSLGGPGDCLAAYVSVFNAALAHGVTKAIVVAAGNDGGDVANNAPANCPQAIAVAATTKGGSLAGYSNFGAGIALSAPGGATLNDLIVHLSNTGATTPAADSFDADAGTSFSAPMVSGVVSLMLSVAPNLTAAQVRSLLTASAKPFPAVSTCNTGICGAGIVDANAAVHAAMTGTVAFNVQGLWWAAGGSESGWGINFAHQGDQVFGTWYTYDTTGKAWWLSMLANRSAGNTYSGNINADTGPPFNDFVGSGKPSQVGTGTLTFTDANNGSFNYTVNGTTQNKVISRYDLGTGPQPTCTYSATTPNFAAATNYQDLWWVAAGAEDGWGINFAHQGNTLFATWYTYDVDGTPLWLSALAPLVAGTANVYSGALYRTAGPRFDAYVGPPASKIVVGTAIVTFADGNHATFAYNTNGAGALPSVSQMKQVTRFPFGPTGGTLCQ